MENENVKRGRGRPKVFTDDEIKKHKTDYMLNKEWYCDVCQNGKNYTLAGKSCHLLTNKHSVNSFEKRNPGFKMVYPRYKCSF